MLQRHIKFDQPLYLFIIDILRNMNMKQSSAFQNTRLKCIIQKYEIEEEEVQSFGESIQNCHINGCLEFVRKKERAQLKEDIGQYYLQENFKPNYSQMHKSEFLEFITLKYSIKEQLRHEELGINSIDMFVNNAVKGKQEKLRAQIVQFLQSIKQSQSSQITHANFQQTLNQQIKKLFKIYQIEQSEFSEFKQKLKENKIEDCLASVRKSKRNQFKKYLEQIIHKFHKYLFTLNQTQNIITIKIKEILKEISANNVEELQNILSSRFDVQSIDQHSVTMNGALITSYQKVFQTSEKQILLKFTPKIFLQFQFKNSQTALWAHQTASQGELKSLIQIEIRNRHSLGEEEQVYICIKDRNKQKEVTFDNLKSFIGLNGGIPFIDSGTIIQVIIYCQEQEKKYQLKSTSSIHDLKLQIEKDFMPLDSQTLEIEKDSLKRYIQISEEYSRLQKFATHGVIQLTLTNHHTTQFYGFQENIEQRFNKFCQFAIERDEDFIQIIKLCDFSKSNQESAFQSAFLKYLNSCIKKKFPMEVVIEKTKNLVIKNKLENIWVPFETEKPKTMNETFLLMYLLRNSDFRLKIQIMNLVKNLMPLPIYIKEFSQIFSKTEKISLNEELVWVLQPGITISSVGLHTQNFTQEKGKTQFLNNIFFTNFCLQMNKHQIVKKIPYIAIKVYDDLFPLNLIDIPNGCDQIIKEKLIESSDLLFIHSWRDEHQTIKFASKLGTKRKVICFIRDCKQSGKQFLKNFSQIDLSSSTMIKVPNFSNVEAHKGSFDIVRQKINLLLLQQKEKLCKSASIFKLTNNTEFESLYKHLQQFNITQNICQFAQYNYIISNQAVITEHKGKIEELAKKKLHPAINSFLQFTSVSKISSDIILMYFRHKLRSLQASRISRYMVIYQIKQKLQKCLQKSRQKYDKQVEQAQRILTQLKLIQSKQRKIKNKQPEEVRKIVDAITSEFQNSIKPKIFSIQLFWREVNAFLKIHPQQKVGKQNLFDLICSLKSAQIMNNQPFQIIDGDSLEMPKHVMSRVFQNYSNQKCLVLTIIGPQSSGKSTLLNFLFGCDFSTSEGRCTRGVYGTYFKINNDSNIKNFEGVFVIDTEGLFALTNQTDEKHEDRDNFDSKLVLFCLAVSDFVILNVRGNLDKNTQKILSLCNQKLQALDLNEDQRPEIIIVLNQNNTSKTEESENQFKKIRKTFNFNISKSLSLAYSIRNFGKSEICLLGQNEVLTKKVPFSKFHVETTNLLIQIVQKMKKKKNIQTVMTKLEKFSQIWLTVLTFPNLSQMTTKQHRKLESEIKAWKKKRQELINSEISNMLVNYQNEKLSEKQATRAIQDLSSCYLSDYQKQFKKQALNQQLKALYEHEKKQISMKSDNNFTKFKYEVIKSNMQRQLIQQKFEGDGILREHQKEIIKNQSQGKVYNQKEKREIFEKGFKSALQKISRTMKLNHKPDFQLQRIRMQYQYCIKSNYSQLQNYGLPKDRINYEKLAITSSYMEVKERLRNQLINNNIKSQENFMKYTQKPYTNVLHGSLSDARLKYLNIKEYFKKEKKQKRYSISQKGLKKSLREDILKRVLREELELERMKKMSKSKVQNMYELINKHLKSAFKLRIKKLADFEGVFEEMTPSIITLFKNSFKSIFSRRANLQLEYVKQQDNISQLQKKELQEKVQKFIKFSEDDFYCKGEKKSSEEGKVRQRKKRQAKQSVKQKQEEQFDNLESPKKEKQEQTKNKTMKSLDAISKMIQKKLNWAQIHQEINDKDVIQENRATIDQLNTKILKQINEDLKCMNIRLKSDSKILEFPLPSPESSLCKVSEMFDKVEIIESTKYIKDENDIFLQLNNLKYFDGSKLKQQIATNTSKTDQFYIGHYQFDVLAPTQKYFVDYKDSNNREMKKIFQDIAFKEFIFNQIKQKKKTLSIFFEEICKIVESTHLNWGRFQSKAIQQVFSEVNQEITQFNNDLNQISHQLHHFAVGSFHMFAIHLMWKKQIDSISKKNNQPYQKKLSSKEDQFQRFLMRTSNDSTQIVKTEVEQFLQKIKSSFEYFIKNKKKAEQNFSINQFQINVRRSSVQKQVDVSIFTDKAKPEIILQYLQKPYEFISKKYEQNYGQYFDQLRSRIKRQRYHEQFWKGVEECINLVKQVFSSITEQRGNPFDLFQMVTKDSKRLDYDEEAKFTLFQYFIDKVLGNDEDIERQCSDIRLKLRRSFPKNPPVSGISRQILLNLKHEKLKISNLVKFLNLILEKKGLQQLSLKLSQMCQLSIEEERQFKNKIRVIICKEKCPCCGRICGVQGLHSQHQCLFGHQMRALAGNYIQKDKKKQAFVVRCEMLKENDLMIYNGNPFTWTQFKQYWRSKPTGRWLYNDLKQPLKQEDKKRCINAWLSAGPLFCMKNGIQYVDYNDAETQLKKQDISIHIIFALDQSGSMLHNWKGLLKTLAQIQIKISKYQSLGNEVFVTIINFSSCARVIYERQKPLQVDISTIPFSSGGTNFEEAFSTTYSVVSKYIHKEQILFIFMTDGNDNYPKRSVENFKTIRENYPKKLVYSGIEFNSSSGVMEIIAKQLQGKNIKASNFEELLNAYSACLEVIAFEEKPNLKKA